MEMRAAEAIGIAQDLTPPLSPLAFSLYDSFLSSRCSACSLHLPDPPFTPIFPVNYPGVPSAPYLLYCSPHCSSLDSPLHFSSGEHRLLQSPLPSSHPDSSHLRLSLRLLHSLRDGNLLKKYGNSNVENGFFLERMGGLMTNYQRLVMDQENLGTIGDENAEDDVRRMIKDGAMAMVSAEKMSDSGSGSLRHECVLMEEAALCSVTTNAVEVQEKNGINIGIAIYGTTFSWINHSCSPNACYRFSTAKPEAGAELRLRISPAAMNDDCGSELQFHDTWDKYKFIEGHGPRIIVRSMKEIKKGEEVTIAYTDLLQPKEMRQSELWSKYRFTCCCQRCSAMPATYVDRALQEIALGHLDCPTSTSDHAFNKDEAIQKLKSCFDDAIAEYLSFGNPQSCCEKLETLLTHDLDNKLESKEQERHANLKVHLLHHLSLNAYTTLASAYKVHACDLLALDNEYDKLQVEALNMNRFSAAYSLLLAGVTQHLFLSEPSLIASVANFWQVQVNPYYVL